MLCGIHHDWYLYKGELPDRHHQPQVPDPQQHPFFMSRNYPMARQQPLPELPWDTSLIEFPFTSTCILMGLLHEDDSFSSTQPRHVQFPPLSAVFCDDRVEYDMVILDISKSEDAKYGIVAFTVCYIAEVIHSDEMFGWHPVEDPLPIREPNFVCTQDRPGY